MDRFTTWMFFTRLSIFSRVPTGLLHPKTGPASGSYETRFINQEESAELSSWHNGPNQKAFLLFTITESYSKF